MSRYEYLRPFCDTDAQREKLDALRDYPTVRAAAAAVGVDMRNMYATTKRLKVKAADTGIAPDESLNTPLPSGQKLRGVTYRANARGELEPYWVKSENDKQKREDELAALLDGFLEKLPRAPKVSLAKSLRNDDLLNLHIVTDYHLGMLAWAPETGADWDLDIASDLLLKLFDYSYKNTPKAHTGVLLNLGDFLHYDGLDSITERGKNPLDADTRYPKMVRTAIKLFRRIIADMLKRYEHVIVIMAEGNHDMSGSVHLREMFAAFMEDEPRITIDTTPLPYYAIEWGSTSLFAHHGHLKKMEKIDTVVADLFREIFGRTRHSFCHMGHLHHDRVVPSDLMKIEQHRTLAAKDAWAARNGYRSTRGAPVITYSKKYGDVGRLEITPEMLGDM